MVVEVAVGATTWQPQCEVEGPILREDGPAASHSTMGSRRSCSAIDAAGAAEITREDLLELMA